MKTNLTLTIFVAAALLISTSVAAQQSQTSQSTQQQSKGDMAGMNMEEMHHDSTKDPDSARSATDSMSDHMDMNAHMFMTSLRPANPKDDERASEIVEIVRKSIDRYKDYRVALADGFEIFLPNLPQEHYHFTNYRYAYEARIRVQSGAPHFAPLQEGERRIRARRRDVHSSEKRDRRRAESNACRSAWRAGTST